MRKVFIILLALCATATMTAQTQRQVYVHSNGVAIFTQTTQQMDSLLFNNGNAVFRYGSGSQWTRSTANIDSITFGNVSTPTIDTTAVDTANGIYITWTNGGAVQIINGYADQGVQIVATNENVVVTSTCTVDNLVYNLSGTSANGSLTITSDSSIIIALNNLTLTNPDGAAICMLSDKKVVVHTLPSTTNAISDGSNSSMKGALQMKGKLVLQGNGTLTVNGYAKHGIQSAGRAKMMSGTVIVNSFAKDGMNVDDFIMYGGTLTVASVGDGIDGDQGMVEINGGTIHVTCTGDDVKGMGCDSTFTINGGSITINMSGDQSKAIKTDNNFLMSNGDVTITNSGTYVSENLDQGYDLSYATGIKADGNINIGGGTIIITLPTSNHGGRAITADGNINIMEGYLNLKTLGASGQYTNSEGAYDSYSSTCIKADGTLNISGGNIVATSYGKCLNADGTLTISGGDLCLNTTGAGATLPSTVSGTSALDGYVSKCINGNGNIVITGGSIRCESSGKGGRGITADGNLIIGEDGASDDKLQIYATTSGAAVNYTSSGMGGGMGGNSSTDYFKGIAKAIRIDGEIILLSGRVSAYCSQSSSTEGIECKGAMQIKGGQMEAYAPDDAVNAGTNLNITGGKLWCYSTSNDALDCNVQSGNMAYISGGQIVLIGGEEGMDMNTDHGGRYTIDGGEILIKRGNMGYWDNPTSRSVRYVTLSSLSTTGSAIYSNNTLIAVLKAESSNSLINTIASCAAKPGPGGPGGQGGGPGGDGMGGTGYIYLNPAFTSSSVSYYTSGTLNGGNTWHSIVNGATFSASGSASTLSTQ